jgi:CheY-like chemotaxis protein
MLADDDGDDIEMFRSAINECSLNIKVSTAGDGRRLIDLLEAEPSPDVIVLDLNMPRMNGYDCLKAIRKNEKYNNVPIIIFSTCALEKDIDYCLGNGANHYIVKPSNFNDLKKLVGNICKGAELKTIVKWE